MKIDKYNVDDNLVIRYGKILKELEQNFSIIVGRARVEMHEEILWSVGLRRGVDDCDKFNECLYEMVKS
jgi:hypothetical protein